MGIEKAAERTDLETESTRELAENVANEVRDNLREREEVRSKEIRERILEALDRDEKRIADSFRTYRKD